MVIPLGINIEGFVLDVVVSFLELPVYILGFKDLTNACFKDQGVCDAGNLFSFNDTFELHAPVCKMSDYR